MNHSWSFICHLPENKSSWVIFEPLADPEGLPFPLFVHPALRLTLAASLIITLVFGAKLRYKIISYIRDRFYTKPFCYNYLRQLPMG